MGKNEKLLVLKKVSLEAIPDGGTFLDGISFLTDKRRLLGTIRAAKSWTQEVIKEVRSARDPNPWRNSTDEEIAGEILRKIEERENAPRKS